MRRRHERQTNPLRSLLEKEGAHRPELTLYMGRGRKRARESAKMARPAFKGCLAHAYRGKTGLHQMLMTGNPRPAHAHRGFAWVCQTLMMQLAGDPHMCTRALVEVTMHVHTWVTGPFVPKCLPTCV